MLATPPADEPALSPRATVILYLEPDTILRQGTSEALREAGFKVIEAASTSEVLDVVESSSVVDVLFTEMQSPGSVDGMFMMEKSRTARPDLRIIVASAQTPGWPFQRIIDAFFGKPYDMTRVIRLIKLLLSQERTDHE